MLRFLALISFVVVVAADASATSHSPAPRLDVPVRCQVHKDCWIANYFDADPGPGGRDYTGGSRTYDGHAGTDFAIRDVHAMNAGVAVIAAAEGKVRALRDGMDDVHVDVIGREAIGGRECGNGVVIDHAPGWATQYCHLRKGSVHVARGQIVKAGDVLGLIGHSGFAAFPHLHFNVLHEDTKVDPFTTGGGDGLWSDAAAIQLGYKPVTIYAAGFRTAVPEGDKLAVGLIEDQPLTDTSPAIVFWTALFGVRTGDRIHVEIEAPDGRILAEREIIQEKNQARRFLWIGRKRGGAAWPAGRYIGRTTVTPGNGSATPLESRETAITIAP